MIKLRKKQKGFTLVELLIVIAIIAVLAAVVTPVALGAINKSKATAVYAEIKSIETAFLSAYVSNPDATYTIDTLELTGLESSQSKNAVYTFAYSEDMATLIVETKGGFDQLVEDMIVGTEGASVSSYQMSDYFTVTSVGSN